jgi:ketosteroid isomerase-like protein
MKKSILYFILITSLFSCTDSSNKTTQNNEQLIHLYFDHFNKHNWKKLAEMYAENADFKDPTLGQGIVKQTRQQMIQKYSELNKIFPDLHDEIVQIYPSSDKYIVVEFVSSGTATDNSKFELPICTIFTIDNGLITKDFTYFDNFDEQKMDK